MKLNDERILVARGMCEFGDGFVNYLGNALFKADLNNARRIKIAFPEYWKEYFKLGKTLGGKL